MKNLKNKTKNFSAHYADSDFSPWERTSQTHVTWKHEKSPPVVTDEKLVWAFCQLAVQVGEAGDVVALQVMVAMQHDSDLHKALVCKR